MSDSRRFTLTWALGACVIGLAGLNLWQATRRPEPTPAPSAAAAEAVASELTQQQITDRFLIQWSDSENTWRKNRFLGIGTQQNPLDVWITQEIITEVKPDVIVEAGTHRGGSAALWATFLAQVNPRGRVLTIDVEDRAAKARKLPIVRRRVDFLLGSSTAPEIVAEVKRRTQGKRVLVILDSLHSEEHVLGELRAYQDIVPRGSYIIVQDGHVNGHPIWPNWGPGPTEAIAAFLKETDAYLPDKTRERLMMTYNPNGFLRRIR
ncbi:MAG: class I SAM-dependent methyltransferase [Deltaproteobacteria bacterium]|nr:class I SAM-dependent methyltransferase [Deltaproteobacteria bacterium]